MDMEKLKEDIKKYPDSYNYERAERLEVSRNGIYYALKRLNITYKKKLNSSESERRREAIFQA
ncbi:MAG TPA: IS630 transposase-related protein [Rickettsia endosymbiont of Pyrocoelia pectoralis]|nr:IS630 transposase-related protein [Rickettsia endosymbiont of Pyrocoelia pectoralis]